MLPSACGSLPPEEALRLRVGEAEPAAPACMAGIADILFCCSVLLIYKR